MHFHDFASYKKLSNIYDVLWSPLKLLRRAAEFVYRTFRGCQFTFRFAAEATHKWLPMRTTAGFAQSSNSRFSGLQKIQLKNRLTGYRLSEVHRFEEELILKSSHLVGEPVQSCTIDSSWFKLERVMEQRGADIYVRTFSEARKPGIPLAELKSAPMRDIRKKLRDCFGEINVIYKVSPQLLSDVPFEDEGAAVVSH